MNRLLQPWMLILLLGWVGACTDSASSSDSGNPAGARSTQTATPWPLIFYPVLEELNPDQAEVGSSVRQLGQKYFRVGPPVQFATQRVEVSIMSTQSMLEYSLTAAAKPGFQSWLNDHREETVIMHMAGIDLSLLRVEPTLPTDGMVSIGSRAEAEPRALALARILSAR
jgi:hypothetical protein